MYLPFTYLLFRIHISTNSLSFKYYFFILSLIFIYSFFNISLWIPNNYIFLIPNNYIFKSLNVNILKFFNNHTFQWFFLMIIFFMLALFFIYQIYISLVGANWSHRYCSHGKWLGLWPNTQSEDKSVSEDDQKRKKWKLYSRKR